MAWLLDRAATYRHSRWEPGPARPLFERAGDLRRSPLGDDHPDTLRLARDLGVALASLGEHDQAHRRDE